ncbi:MAG TPA: 3' terminal RNA ribose 2'-O-methyltransferase Hen1 [Armatimonadota bacterium]|jgi:3' terminal RNA ribose 2'-O-methyltransferase Hen1
MLLTISTTHTPATDLGYLLHKNPARAQSFDLSFGKAHVFYPEAGDERCTAALMIELDTVGFVRGGRGPAGEGFALRQYVNDRPYAASSFMSVAIARVFGTALSGRCAQRPELVETPIPLTATLAALPCRGGEALLRRLFEPLGYRVEASRHPLDPAFPEWGDSPYFTVTLSANARLADLLSHLYVLIPVLDDEKHYWVDAEEVEKPLRHGEAWLPAHPERETIVQRYLRRRKEYTREALARLAEEDAPDPDAEEEARNREEETVEAPMRLNDARMAAVAGALRETGARRVLDLGCGEGRLIKALMADRQFTEIAGIDVSLRSLEIAERRLNLENLAPRQRERVRLLHGSLVYRDRRLEGYDAAAVVEVIEHLDPPRLVAFERALFEFARPGAVVVTTPNSEYNALWESLPAGSLRHRDHRFEWTRAEFAAWANAVAERHGYSVAFSPIGPEDPALGAPTQMALFTLNDTR